MILNDNSTQQINTLVIQLQNKITNLTNEFRKLNNNIDDLDREISDLEKRVNSNVNDASDSASAMNAAIKANTLAISGKADKIHTHTKSEITDFDHTHDDRYYTESEVDAKLSGKSDTGHTHTKSQITDFPTSLPAKAYQLFGTQAVGWVKLGTLTSKPSESIVISVCSGGGFNGHAFQNSQFRIMIKNGNQSVQSATYAFGVTVEKTEASDKVEVKVIAFANNVCDVWVYMPWAYYAGNYSIVGLYLKWVHSGEYQSSKPSGTEQSLLYRTILNSEDAQTITGAKTFTENITAPNITDLEQRVAALESKI